jgi:hypothetical protein
MLKTFNYYDIINLLDNPSRERFVFDNIEYNTYFAKDKTLLINSFKDSSFKPQKLTTFIYSLNKRLGKENHPTQIRQAKPQPQVEYNPLPTVKKITNAKKLSPQFLANMQLSSIFKSDYEKHPNIKYFSDGEMSHEVLYFTDGIRHNARFKWNGRFNYNGWSTFKRERGFKSIGAYLKGTNKKRTTLILCEGLKDAINANIALPQCDILATDSKTIKLHFSHLGNKDYKTVILFQDRDLSNKDIVNLFGELQGEDRKLLNKTYYVDINKLSNGVKDITDFLQSLNMTAKGLKRNALREIKKVLHSERVKHLENAIEIDEKINPLIEHVKRFNNLSLFKELVQKKIKLGGDITEDIKYYIQLQVTPPQNHKLVNLNSSKFLGNVTGQIIEEFKMHNKIILGSPTGTGKSTFVKENLTKHYKNMIIIAPLKKVAGELSETNKANITHIENNEKLDYILANIYSPYISITTDTFYNLLNNKKTEHELKERLAKCELVVFDEQHIVHQSHNFRGKVIAINEFLRDSSYNGKVLFMSGTPIYSDVPNFHPILCKLNKRYFSTIEYYLDPFRDEAHLLENIKDELEKGNVLLYSKSRTQAKLIQKYLIENSVNTLLITSRGNVKKLLQDKEEITLEDEEINNIKENIAIISTTRATTGANFERLSVIYQFGSSYDPHTFIQLMARIRGNGKYYFIKTAGDKAQDESLMNKAINILNVAKKFNLKKTSELFTDHTKNAYIQKNIELPYQDQSHEAFLRTYKRALQLIESESLGKLTQDDDFEFTNRLEDIKEDSFKNIFVNGDSAEFTKYIEREMIDFLQRKGDIEILNNAYNLSFRIIHKNRELDYSDVNSKEFITEDDKAEKKLKSEERKEKQDLFIKDVESKFNWLLNAKNKKEFLNPSRGGFTSGEIATLMGDKRLEDIAVQKKILAGTRTNKEKFTRLKFFLIGKTIIINKIIEAIKVKNFVTITELSNILEQEVRLTMKKNKAPFSQFLKDFLEDEKITKNGLEFYKAKKINKKTEYNVITLPKDKLKELKKIKDIEKREQTRIAELERVHDQISKDVIVHIDYTPKLARYSKQELVNLYDTNREILNNPQRRRFYPHAEIDRIERQQLEILELLTSPLY